MCASALLQRVYHLRFPVRNPYISMCVNVDCGHDNVIQFSVLLFVKALMTLLIYLYYICLAGKSDCVSISNVTALSMNALLRCFHMYISVQ